MAEPAEPANHKIVARTGLWCDRCLLPHRCTYDVTVGSTTVAALEGCTTCQTGVCAPPPTDVDAAFAAIVESLTP